MKPHLLANENFPMPSVAVLRKDGYDVLAITETHRSMSDLEILSVAVSENRWIVTFDRDYGELIFAKNLPTPRCFQSKRAVRYHPGR